ncbi:SPW repeat domain-containing protein [Teichococcus vastitatis]|uniref:SPW repeat protein n=1 Tax=Teichococcus vastitatis TaxID=2307076 RepID=A0ABS9WA15_9PROT|nr:SPW repeat protein [Pseudoroseomonas vastitatis]MCI0755828.1 SPW repeat protein [Pseudoroseomonas vastitatis]
MIPRSIHALIDYLFAFILIGAPYALQFAGEAPEHTVFWIVGFGSIAYSLLTDYRLGLLKWIPFRAHLAMDFVAGLFLVASPWLLGFSDRIWLPHVIFGLLEIGVVLLTRRTDDTLPNALRNRAR